MSVLIIASLYRRDDPYRHYEPLDGCLSAPPLKLLAIITVSGRYRLGVVLPTTLLVTHGGFHDHPCAVCMSVQYTPIGTVRSPYEASAAVARDADAEGEVVLEDDYVAGLDGLAEFFQAVVLVGLDRSDTASLTARSPHADGVEVGVFLTRSPHQQNAIAETVVEVDGRDGATLVVRGLDLVDGTPVLDLKPHVPRVPSGDVETGWVTPTE